MLRFHPAADAVYFACILTVAMFSFNPVLLLLALAGSVAFLAVQSGRSAFRHAGSYVVLFILIAAVNPIFTHNGATVAFFFNGRAITLEAAVYGVFAAVMILSALLWFQGFSIVMTSDRLQCLIGRAAPKISLTLSMALRFVPALRRRAGQVRSARTAMGLYSGEGITDKIRSSVHTFSAVTAWALEGSVDTADSMRARGYELHRHTRFTYLRFCGCDLLLIAASIVLFGFTMSGIVSGAVDFAFYPIIVSPPLTVTAALAYISYAVLVFLPVAVKLKEWVKWMLCRSRI